MLTRPLLCGRLLGSLLAGKAGATEASSSKLFTGKVAVAGTRGAEGSGQGVGTRLRPQMLSPGGSFVFAVYFKAIVRWAFTRSQAELSPPAPPPTWLVLL